MERKVLIVDDERSIVDILKYNIEKDGTKAICAYDGKEGLRLARTEDPDVILLDVMLPEMDGFEVCRTLRAEGNNVPIIMITAREEETDKVFGLDLGADDYITKPFSMRELLARVRVALRRLDRERAMKGDADEAVYRNGSLRIDYAAGSVWRDDEEIHLTPFEYKLLCLLARNTGKVLTHNYLLKEVWGTMLASDRSSLRVFMATLRKKIEPDPANPRYIQTHVGVGYRMMRVE